jgi:hypothetical protein
MDNKGKTKPFASHAMDNKGKTKYQQQQKAGNKPSSGRQSSNAARPNTLEASEKARSRELADEIDGRFGFHRMVEVSRRHLARSPGGFTLD